MSEIVVMKFGGTSVAGPEDLKRAAARIVAAREAGSRVVAVLSARGKTTDDLVEMAHEISERPFEREMDMLLSAERVARLLFMAPPECTISFSLSVLPLSGVRLSETNLLGTRRQAKAYPTFVRSIIYDATGMYDKLQLVGFSLRLRAL